MLPTVWLVLIIGFSLYSLSTYIRPLEGKRDARGLLLGILGLVYAAMMFRTTYSIVFARLPHAAILFHILRALLGGIWTAILLAMGFRRHGATIMLIFAGTLAIASTLAVALLLHRTGRAVTLHSVLSVPRLYSLEAGPFGIAIAAAVLLWRPAGNDTRLPARGSELTDAEHVAESGTGA
jgi:hypothetical protein